MGVLVDRRRVLQRIRRSAAPLIALVAPAGYGKSYIAQRIAREDPHWAIVDANDTADAAAFAQALAGVPILSGGGSRDLHGLVTAWSVCPEPISLILENLESATPDLLEAVADLVRSRPPTGKLIMCARRALAFELSDFAAPHLVATLRADDLRFDHAEMAQLFAETEADPTALFRASRFTEGWPVVALYLQRIMQEGAFDPQHDSVPDALLTELFDYVDAQIIGKLPAPSRRALIAASGWNDLTDAEIEDAYDEPGTVFELVRVHQLARPGAQQRVELHPLVRRTVAQRHGRQLIAAMRLMAERFVADERFARGAECYLMANDIDAAADCGRQVEGGFLTLVGTRPSGAGYSDDTAGLATHPEIRLAILSARRLIEPSRDLPREALSVLESTRGETVALDNAGLGIAVLALLDAGRSTEAAALLDAAPLKDGEPANGPELVLLTARLALCGHLGRFEDGMRLWQPLRRRISGNAVWLSQIIRFEVQAARARARWEVEHEALERMLSLARTGRAVPMIGLALAEAVFGSWLAGEDALFETYRTRLVALVERYDIPALLRFTLAASGRAPRVDRSDAPLWDARAFLIAAADAQDGALAARYVQAAVEAAEIHGGPLMKVLVRVAAAEKFGSARGRLREAVALCDTIESAPLRDSVVALSEHGDVRGMLAPLVNRLRHRASIIIAGEDAPLLISLADGTVARGDERIDVSEGVLALLLALAVEAQAVTRDRLVDRLWPDLQDESAYNALKMCVHRTRQQLASPGAIVVSRGGYSLAAEIEVDLRRLQRTLERVRRDTVPATEMPQLEATFASLVRGRPAAFADWEWFEPVEQTLEAATHEVGAFIAARALRDGDDVRALGIAQALTKLDPLNENARQIAINAHIAANDRSAAILEYRAYKALLRTELDVEPSPDLKRLLEGELVTAR
jgi:DNA-binding SARP family transcriptional activator